MWGVTLTRHRIGLIVAVALGCALLPSAVGGP